MQQNVFKLKLEKSKPSFDHHKPYMLHYNRLLIWNHYWLYAADFIEEFTCLVHKLSVILTALDYKPHWKKGKNIQALAYNGMHMVLNKARTSKNRAA